MTKTSRLHDQHRSAAFGLHATACGSALAAVAEQEGRYPVRATLRQIADLARLLQRAEWCAVAAARAEAAGKDDIAAMEWSQALVLLDRLATEATDRPAPAQAASASQPCEPQRRYAMSPPANRP